MSPERLERGDTIDSILILDKIKMPYRVVDLTDLLKFHVYKITTQIQDAIKVIPLYNGAIGPNGEYEWIMGIEKETMKPFEVQLINRLSKYPQIRISKKEDT